MTASLYWLILGAVFLGLEAFGIPGIGFLFAGLGALFVGLMIETGILAATDPVWQVAAFFINSSLLALLLWKRLKTWRLSQSDAPYSNMVGDEAVVVEPVSAHGGTARWSGTLMQARLADPAAPPLAPGSYVTIAEVKGNILIVIPKR